MVNKADFNSQAVVAGIATFLVAEAALLAIGKFKFEDTWALIKWTPAAMVAGGGAFLAAKQLRGSDHKSADKVDTVAAEALEQGITVDNITVEEIDRIEALFTEACGGIVDELLAMDADETLSAQDRIAKFDQLLSSVEVSVSDSDRVGVMCFISRHNKQSYVAQVAERKAAEVAKARGWNNDRVWCGRPDAPRGNTILTLY